MVTIQPKEALSTATKAKITITNYLGGQYFFTVDEVKISTEFLYMIECKHTKNALFPSKSDIKDGILKLILYCNIAAVKIGRKSYTCIPVLKLTAVKMIGSINSKTNTAKEIDAFLKRNEFSVSQTTFIKTLFNEASKNNFQVIIEHAK